ncbi:MAG: segregation and condensation protein A [Planctomycetota bacterium]
MSDELFTVKLQKVFQGPMDLLLHLVREQEVEIQEIEISRILDGYLGYLGDLTNLDIETAGDFLVMAATLMAIKSRSLLPGEEVDLEDELDPKDELIQRLIEYRRFREASEELERGFLERQCMLPRGYKGELAVPSAEREFDLGDLTIWDVFATFSRLMRETLANRPHQISGDPRPLRFYVEEFVQRLRTDGSVSLRALVRAFGHDVPPREALIGSFCALLELVKMELIEVEQEGDVDDIQIVVAEGHGQDLEDVIHRSRLDGEPHSAAEDAEAEESPGKADTPPGDLGPSPS